MYILQYTSYTQVSRQRSGIRKTQMAVYAYNFINIGKKIHYRIRLGTQVLLLLIIKYAVLTQVHEYYTVPRVIRILYYYNGCEKKKNVQRIIGTCRKTSNYARLAVSSARKAVNPKLMWQLDCVSFSCVCTDIIQRRRLPFR